jgi:putative PIN family toxin of toxin-antitoxin system
MPRSAARPPVVVLDTNVVLSALLFANGRLAPLRAAWQGGRCEVLVSKPTASELMRVLGYPKFKLSADEREELLADCLPHWRSVRIPANLPKLPQCRNANDQMFIELAAAGKADFLVSGDKDLLVLSPQFSGRIVTADAFIERLNG